MIDHAAMRDYLNLLERQIIAGERAIAQKVLDRFGWIIFWKTEGNRYIWNRRYNGVYSHLEQFTIERLPKERWSSLARRAALTAVQIEKANLRRYL